ncbi:MAG TPA: peptidyl-prolyl cis-trans isomerase [Rariglobus sp.]|jgi:peptidyl-prolyl cis-trans isomerase D|nr:peptidyl-prolyl cis-trans isomerase [Rariglobus sp.]
MISWIQKTFQQHFRTIFLVMLAVIIVSFVVSFGPSSGLSGAHPKTLSRTFFDLDLGSADDQQRLMDDANLSVTLQAGYGALQGDRLQQYALQRYAALHLAEQLHLPDPTQQEISEHVQTLRAFAGQDGQFDAKRYADFRDSLKTNPRLRESDVLRVLADDVIYNRVEKLLSGPGYVLASDVKNQLIRADSLWTIAAIDVDYTSFTLKIDPAAADLEKYFEDNSFRYEIPPKVSLEYLNFPAADFVSKVNVTDAEVRAYYDANPARFPKPADAKTPSLITPPAGPDADFAAVRPQVEAALKLERAQRLAAETASDVSVALYEGKVTAAGLDAFLAPRKLVLKSAAPFDHDNVPAELAGPQVADEAFKLGADKPFSDVVTTASGAAILVWKNTIPARKPALAEVTARVTADYLENEKRKRFVDLGRSLRETLEARLKAGDTLDKAVEAARATTTAKITVKTWPAFTLATPPKDIDYSLYGAIDTLQKGGLSQMVIAGDKGIIAYAVDKKLPDLDPTSAKYIETRDKIASYTASRDSSDALRTIIDNELAKSAPAVEQ